MPRIRSVRKPAAGPSIGREIRNSNAPGFSGCHVHLWRHSRRGGRRRGIGGAEQGDGRYSEKPDAAIVVFGEGPYAESPRRPGDSRNSRPTDQHNLGASSRRLRADGVPTVAVFLSGRPLWVNPLINASDAFVAAWLPGSEGEGVADVLFRSTGAEHHDFTGRLAFSWPQTAMPVTFDAAGKAAGALFPRGWGLDYRSSADSPRLSEDPQIPPHWAAQRGSLFHDGHVTAPWSIFVADDGAGGASPTTARQAKS